MVLWKARELYWHGCIYYQKLYTQLVQCNRLYKYEEVIFNLQNHIKMRTQIQMATFLLLISLINAFVASPSKVTQININNDWVLELIKVPSQKNHLQNISFKTILPSTLHLDLLKHQKIEDPFHRDNYPKLKWVSQCNVKYSKNFEVDENNLKRAAEIVFHGIDTYATVKLNGNQIIKANNAFVRYTTRVEKYLQKNNILEVIIQSSQDYDNKAQSLNPMPFRYAHTRKACYQYSWDWAPELITVGIWKDVELRFYDEIRIDYVWARNRLVSEEKAIINFATKFQLNLFKDDKLTQGYTLIVLCNGTKLNEIKVKEQTAYVDVEIKNPKLWWPHGIGEPFIYDFVVSLQKGSEIIDQRKIPFGIRTAELNLQNKQFQVKINGNPVYCKGANYVPLDMLHPRIYNKEFQNNKTYAIQDLFDDIVDSNFNMIRIWGGGQYESDQFMELASRKGIMVFYDFMFSDSIYPSTPSFLENVQEEIKQQVRRTRNYPALTIWCGNNQILQGIKDWGWSSEKYTKDYDRLFEKLIRKVVNIENPDIAYIPSSPIYGVGNFNFQRGGDFHYWSVWAGGAPFESYETAVGPFNSQFGTQALPVWQTIKEFTLEEDRNYQSPVLLAHERHNSQFGTLRNYISRYMNKSKDFDNQVYMSGVVQAYAIEIAIKAQRAAKPKCYGTLYWQLNDAWPAISWSSIDYYGRWKALQYMAKRNYGNIALFAFDNGSVIAINDNLYPVDVVAKMSVIEFDGNILSKDQRTLTLEADSAKQVFNLIAKQKYGDKLKRVVMYTQIFYKEVKQMCSTKYFALMKELELPKAAINVKYNLQKNEIQIWSDKLVKNLFIDHKQQYVQLSDNYFDVVPGYPVTVSVQKGVSLSSIKSRLSYNSIRQASEPQELQVKFN